MGSFIFWVADKSISELKFEMVEAFKCGPHGGHPYLLRTKFLQGNKLQTMEKLLKEGLNMAFIGPTTSKKKTIKGSNCIKWANKFVY